ncbi:GNAT family N-acetyltransferase [Spongiimicrobium salis]|uniref:GNAT family N-acetyltransferase n=1 Tax=Spongiimicrobium salis TaxID=1667022 RepID=UPI00374CAA1A
MIRRAKISEITDILTITKACSAHMIKKGIYQWNEHYPDAQTFEKDLQRKELYVLEREGIIVGTIVLSTFMDEEYKAVNWNTPTGKNLYIHRLSVIPELQGKGYAQKLMDFGEQYAREQQFVSVRLDTFSQNPRNQKFYETRGYSKLGSIAFPLQSEHPFYCYELIL